MIFFAAKRRYLSQRMSIKKARSCYTNLVQVSRYQLAADYSALAQEIGFWLINAVGLYPKAVCAILPIRVTAEYADTGQE